MVCEVPVKFARIVFIIAGIWGVLLLTPLYFLFDMINQQDPPPITHPAFFYGFVGVALAWQVAFFIVARDPVRFRPIMIPSILEKLGYGGAVVLLYAQGRMHPQDLAFGLVDLVFVVLFAIAFVAVGKAR
jgi:hypothetical protein